MILDYPLAGSHYNRMIQNSNNSLFGSLSLGDHLFLLIAGLLGQYVKCKQDENSGFLSHSLEVIPYLVCLTVALRAIEAEYAFSDFRLHRELVILGFLYLLAYFLQSYL